MSKVLKPCHILDRLHDWFDLYKNQNYERAERELKPAIDELYDYQQKDKQIADLKQQLEHYKGTKLEDYSNEIRELKQKLEAKDRNALALFSALYEVLEKQDPENVSTRIDFLTKQDNGKINDIYKEWRVLEQQLAELQDKLGDAEEHIDSLELQLREQYQIVDKLVKKNNKLKNLNRKHKGEK